MVFGIFPLHWSTCPAIFVKTAIPVILVLIILLNTMGYYGIFLGLRYQNDIAMSRVIDSDDYDPSQTVTLKIPVTVAYMPDQSDYERVSGQFEYNGVLYRLVKQRYAKDTLTIVCFKDMEHMKIDRVLTDYVKTFTDTTTDGKSSSKITINFLKDYLPITFSIRSAAEGWALPVVYNHDRQHLISAFTTAIIHPPESRRV